MQRPKIGITLGCPCGIGPEIVQKAVSNKDVLSICIPVIYGDPGCRPANAKACGQASMMAVDDAVRAAMTGEIKAIVTAPIDKAHWKAAGSPFLGHTEYLAHISGSKNVAMMMVSPKLCVTVVTTHIPLAEVPKAITIKKICEVTKLTYGSLDKITGGAATPYRIAVCGLNPHAGDHGAIGDEDEKVIAPAIELLRSQGIPAFGPFAADTVFHKAAGGDFEAVIAMYHDQGLIPIKTLDFAGTVNVTLGLPFVRTSPDHGTAADIAGKGVADHRNMVEAIKMAVRFLKSLDMRPGNIKNGDKNDI